MSEIQELDVDVRDDPEALRRIVAVCRRRNCRIVFMHYQTTPDSGSDRLVLRLAGEAKQTSRAERWLLGLVDVLAVRSSSPDGAPASAQSPASSVG